MDPPCWTAAKQGNRREERSKGNHTLFNEGFRGFGRPGALVLSAYRGVEHVLHDRESMRDFQASSTVTTARFEESGI
jgi:hypothetical protein